MAFLLLAALFAAGLHYVILSAKATAPPALSMNLVAALLIGAVIWTGALYARLRIMS